MLKVSHEEFLLWSNLIFEYTGIVIGDNKRYLIENRLSELAVETGSKTFSELYYKCRYAADDEIKKKVIDRISTQETSFFRDPHVYKAFQALLREEIIPLKRSLQGAGRPRLRLWSAACSTGQEPYSIVMLLAETVPDLDRWDLTIMATDLADNAFRKASLGRYTQLEAHRGLDNYHLAKYFSARPDNLWQIRDSLRALVSFRKINLVSDQFRGLGVFDVVFCRNVAIYFDQATKEKLFLKLAEVLSPEGYLVVGAAESLSQFAPIFRPVSKYNCTFYLRVAGATLR
ncbi:MAG: protein-glutamate O-methyltransferase CheR [Thermodesulfobacteriota bacterium]